MSNKLRGIASNMALNFKKTPITLIKLVLLGAVITFHDFLIPKIILGTIGVVIGGSIAIGIAGIAISLVATVVYLAKIGIGYIIKQRSKKNVDNILNDYKQQVQYAKDRVDAIQKGYTDKQKVVYMDEFIPMTEERYNAIPKSHDFNVYYKEYQKTEKELQIENNSDNRNKLKRQLIELSFKLQDLATRSIISETDYNNMEHLYQNSDVQRIYENVEKVEKKAKHDLKWVMKKM